MSQFFANSLKKLMMDKETCDVNFLFEETDEKGQEIQLMIPAHKYVLASASSVFRAMFYGPLRELSDVKISDCTYEAFKEFLQFFYMESPDLNGKYMLEVTCLVDKYDIRECLPHCEKMLKIKWKKETICNIFDLAEKEKLTTEFIEAVKVYIQQNAQEIFETDEFMDCSLTTLKSILNFDELICGSELEVFKAAMNWAENACERKRAQASDSNKRTVLGDCFKLIRFSTMSTEMILKLIEEFPKVLTSDEWLELLQFNIRGIPLKTFKSYASRKC